MHARIADRKLNNKNISLKTSSYTRAKAKLSVDAIKRLAKRVGIEAKDEANSDWRWKNREVTILDGTSITMADTKENVEKYPKRSDQKHTGYPLARLVIASSLESGTVTDMEMAPFKGKGTGETSLGKKILKRLAPDEIVLGDAIFATYSFMNDCLSQNIDFLIPKKNNRKYEIIKSSKIGDGDRLITIKKPRYHYDGSISKEDQKQLPDYIELRETEVTIIKDGFRPVKIIVLSNLTEYSKQDLSDLLLCRWNIELDIRVLKRELAMNFIASKTPDMVQKEVWVNILAFNLIRRLINNIAHKLHQSPRNFSFKNSMGYYLKTYASKKLNLLEKIPSQLLKAISMFKVKKQPGRCEPRAKKSNSDACAFPLLSMSRSQWKLLNILTFLSSQVDLPQSVFTKAHELTEKISKANGQRKY